MAQTVVLAHPLNPSSAVDLGLQNRPYAIGESILVSDVDAVRLIRYGLAAQPGAIVTPPPDGGGGTPGGGGGGGATYVPITIYWQSDALPVRSKIRFVGGGVTVTDDPVNAMTVVTISGGGGGGGGGGGVDGGGPYPGTNTYPGTDLFPWSMGGEDMILDGGTPGSVFAAGGVDGGTPSSVY